MQPSSNYNPIIRETSINLLSQVMEPKSVSKPVLQVDGISIDSVVDLTLIELVSSIQASIISTEMVQCVEETPVVSQESVSSIVHTCDKLAAYFQRRRALRMKRGGGYATINVQNLIKPTKQVTKKRATTKHSKASKPDASPVRRLSILGSIC
jgi:L-fucose mutarotase/ribose pyranase (RbsD/FucU family)